MIPAKIWYKTYDIKLLAIVETFQAWLYYLEGCKYEVTVLTDYNKLCRFIDTKSLSSRQARWARKVSWYHFQINNHQSKANRATDALSWYAQ